MTKILRNLKIDDVSSVDVGAGKGVRVVLHKRDKGARRFPVRRHADFSKHRDGVPAIYGKPLEFGSDLPAEALAYLKREFSAKERQARADNGHALPDGSFPIDNKDDLHNAVQAIGRAKNPAKAKAHIKARAAALGAEDALPDDWSKRDATAAPKAGDVLRMVKGLVERAVAQAGEEEVGKAAVDFTEAIQAADDVEDATDLMSDVRDAVCALDCSINSILCDEDVADKPAAITTSYQQFKAYIGGLGLEDDDDADNTEKRDMGVTDINPAVKKVLEEAIAKVAGEKDAEIAKLAAQVAYLKMSDKHKAYHDGLGSDADKKKFVAMSDDDKDAEMEKTKKRAEDDPIYKAMRTENEKLQKRLAALEDEQALTIAKRDAKEMGLTQNDAGEVVMKMRRGDPAAIKTYEGYMVALAKAKGEIERTSKVFDEFGTGRGNDGTKGGNSANVLLKAKADELRAKDPKLTEAQAFEKVYLDPANRDLMDQERAERMAKIHRVA